MIPHHRPLAVLLLSALCAACVTEQPGPSKRKPEEVPWPQDGAPFAVAHLLEDLTRFQDTVGRVPDSLQELGHSKLVADRSYADADFVYHPRGIGILRGGWRLIALAAVEKDGKVWGIAAPPARVTTEPRYHAVNIPLVELRDTAERMEAAKEPEKGSEKEPERK